MFFWQNSTSIDNEMANNSKIKGSMRFQGLALQWFSELLAQKRRKTRSISIFTKSDIIGGSLFKSFPFHLTGSWFGIFFGLGLTETYRWGKIGPLKYRSAPCQNGAICWHSVSLKPCVSALTFRCISPHILTVFELGYRRWLVPTRHQLRWTVRGVVNTVEGWRHWQKGKHPPINHTKRIRWLLSKNYDGIYLKPEYIVNAMTGIRREANWS